MEKDALLKVILNDIREVETLVQTFSGSKPINSAFLKLTLQKINTIQQEVEMLQVVNDTQDSTLVEDSPEIQEDELASKQQKQVTNQVNTETKDSSNQEKNKSDDTFIIEDELKVTEDLKDSELNATTKDERKEEKIQIENPDLNINKENKADVKPATLGESLGKDKKSIIDKLPQKNESSNKVLIGKPVDDIKKALGINDRFLYQRELFEGSAEIMNQTLDELNNLGSFADAQSFLKLNFTWDFENETVVAFLKTIQRKFIS